MQHSRKERGRLGSDMSGDRRARAGSDMSGGRSRAGSDASAASRQSEESKQNDDVPLVITTLKDSILSAASKSELPSVRWPALKILLELSWEEEFKMSLLESKAPAPWQQVAQAVCFGDCSIRSQLRRVVLKEEL